VGLVRQALQLLSLYIDVGSFCCCHNRIFSHNFFRGLKSTISMLWDALSGFSVHTEIKHEK